jgi:hypothetical protein
LVTQPTPDSSGYVGQEEPNSGSSDLNAQTYLFNRLMIGVWTNAIVRVEAVTNVDAMAPVGFVDILPLVHQIDGRGTATPHGTIHNVPYFRLQGGANAVIIDPKVGDIGLAQFASRDISAVKKTKGPNVPGSRRRFSPSDALYIGGFLNGVPTQYIRFSAAGIELVSPTQVRIQAPDIQLVGPTHTTGAVTGDSTAVYDGNVTGGGISLDTHHHTGVQTGGGNTGGPA